MQRDNRPLVAIVSNEPTWTYNLRREIIETLLDSGYRVALMVGYGKKLDPLIKKGCEHYDIQLDRHGLNPLHELKLLIQYRKVIRKIRPDFVLTFTLKPNSYAGLVCRFEKIPYIPNVTGLGNPIKNGGIVRSISLFLLKQGIMGAKTVFLQNIENHEYLTRKNIICGKSRVLPGSGVNTDFFNYFQYPSGNKVKFVFVSRVMKQKGIDEYIEAAKYIRVKYSFTEFHICGFCEESYEAQMRSLSDAGILIYHGMVDDIRSVYRESHCVILPSYHEGMANALLEAAATGRPVIASRIHGCEETFDEGISGFGCQVRDKDSLIQAIEKFLSLNHNEKEKMGIAARKKIVNEFDRKIIVSAYLHEIKN